MYANTKEDLEGIVRACWLAPGRSDQLLNQPAPANLPFSQVFYLACTSVRLVIQAYSRSYTDCVRLD